MKWSNSKFEFGIERQISNFILRFQYFNNLQLQGRIKKLNLEQGRWKLEIWIWMRNGHWNGNENWNRNLNWNENWSGYWNGNENWNKI